LRPFLNKRAKMLLTRLDAETAEDYGKVKEYLLREMKLTPRVYLEKFQSLTKIDNETYVLFVSRLKAILDFYLESRSVTILDQLKSLLVADRLKQSFEGTFVARHVSIIESQLTEGKWLSARELAVAVDQFLATRPPQKNRARVRRSAPEVPPISSEVKQRLVTLGST